jgi:anaerobic selenocysteine-containing dehydrogenase
MKSIYTNTPAHEETFEKFWKRVCRDGGWWDRHYFHGEWERVFKTKGNRFAFFSRELKDKFDRIVTDRAQKKSIDAETAHEEVLSDLGIQARGDMVFLPHYEPPKFAGSDRDFRLHLNLYKTMTQAEGRGANLPHLQEIFGLHVLEAWGSWVELSPEDAHELKIHDGDDVWIESLIGRIRAKARIYSGTKPGVVNMPYGQGHTAYGRWAKGRGGNPNEIVPAASDVLGGSLAGQATRVRIYKPS